MKTQEKPLKVTVRRKKAFTVNKGKVVPKSPQKRAQEKTGHKNKPTLKESLAMLETRWPKLFNVKNPKPLKIGTFAEIVKRENLSSEECKNIALAIRRYCNSLGYQVSMLKSTHRYDLEGKESGKVEPNHRNLANVKMNNIKKKIAKRKKKRAANSGKEPA